ncbi:hypothetical protein KCU71_g5270, partial [Aureobasidium melanogenum]
MKGVRSFWTMCQSLGVTLRQSSVRTWPTRTALRLVELRTQNTPNWPLSGALQEKEMKITQEPPDVEQQPTTEPKWIPVEDLSSYYANHKPIGRKYPAQSQLDFENLYIEDSRDEIQDSESEVDENKEAAKLATNSTVQSTRKTQAKVEAKADLISQVVTSKSTKEKCKNKMKEEESIEDDEKKDFQCKDPDGEKYKSCDTCTWAKVKCVPGKKSNMDGDKICLQCEKRDRQCHFSTKGQRPGKP